MSREDRIKNKIKDLQNHGTNSELDGSSQNNRGRRSSILKLIPNNSINKKKTHIGTNNTRHSMQVNKNDTKFFLLLFSLKS